MTRTLKRKQLSFIDSPNTKNINGTGRSLLLDSIKIEILPNSVLTHLILKQSKEKYLA